MLLPIKLTALKMSSKAGMLFAQLPQSAIIYTTCEHHKKIGLLNNMRADNCT